MKTCKLTGIILIGFGIVALAFHGLTYTGREMVTEVGTIQMMAGHAQILPMSPLGGAVVLVGGIVLLVM